LNVLPVLEKGFGIATFNYTDVDPDALGAVLHGVRKLYLKEGQTEPAPDEWVRLRPGRGPEPGDRLLRDGRRRGRQADRHHGRVAAGQDRALAGLTTRVSRW